MNYKSVENAFKRLQQHEKEFSEMIKDYEPVERDMLLGKIQPAMSILNDLMDFLGEANITDIIMGSGN